MISVKIRKGDVLNQIVCKDHATGSAEVCAAVSCLMYTLAGWLENNKSHVYKPIVILEPGNSTITFGGDEIAQAVFESTAIGLMQLEKSHPDYIRIDL